MCVAQFSIKRAPNVNFQEFGLEQSISFSCEAKYPVVTKYSGHIFHCSITAYSLLNKLFYGTNQNVNVIIEGLVYFSYIRSSVKWKHNIRCVATESVSSREKTIKHERTQENIPQAFLPFYFFYFYVSWTVFVYFYLYLRLTWISFSGIKIDNITTIQCNAERSASDHIAPILHDK